MSSAGSGGAVTGGAGAGGAGEAPGDAAVVAAGAAASWSRLADGAQQSLTEHFQSRLFGARWLHNTAPLRLAQLTTFNYWWLAHGVEVRVDGAERRGTGGRPGTTSEGAPSREARARIALAENTYAGILCRNRGLFNHYFDDMGWLALAAVRLFDLTGSERYLADAEALWEHIREKGGSRERPGAIAWRDSQLDYLNAPTNGAFAILSARLATRVASRDAVRAGAGAGTGGPDPAAVTQTAVAPTSAPAAQLSGGVPAAARYAAAADESLDFLTDTLVTGQQSAIDEGLPPGAADLVADGVNRQGDGALDTGWLFTYNQGLYLGALVEAFDRTADPKLLDRATRTAAATLAALAPAGRVVGEPARLGERGGGDAGLFKGIFLRYLELLLERLPVDGDGFRMLEPAFTAMTDLLAAAVPTPPAGATPPPFSLVDDDWAAIPAPAPAVAAARGPKRTTALTTQLAAVMAVEARARFELHLASPAAPPR